MRTDLFSQLELWVSFVVQFEHQVALLPSAFEQMRTVEAAAQSRAAKLELDTVDKQEQLRAAQRLAAEADMKEVGHVFISAG